MRLLRAILAAAAASALLAASPALAAPTPGPAFSLTSLATPTNFKPGGEKEVPYTYDVRAANLGAAPTDPKEPITITDTLPKGISVKAVTMFLRSSEGKTDYGPNPEACKVKEAAEVATVSCEISNSLPESAEPALVAPSEERRVVIEVNPPPDLGGANEGETLTNHVTVQGGGAEPASTTSQGEVSKDPAPAGVALLHTAITEVDGSSSGQAGAHPYQMTVGFAVNTKPGREGAEAKFVPAGGDVKDIEVTLPAGLSGAGALTRERCSPLDFNTTHSVTVGSGPTNGFFTANACSDAAVVGLVLVQRIEGVASVAPVPLYNLDPPPGVAAEFGAQILNLPFYIDVQAPPKAGYRAVATLHNLTQFKRLVAATTVIWGVPADPLHDPVRGSCLNELPETLPITMPGCEPLEGVEEKPLLRLPSSCASPLDIGFGFDSWTAPGQLVSATSAGVTPGGCDEVPFAPSLEAIPSTDVADSPTGLHVHLHVPQPEEPGKPGEADLRKTVVRLPRGLAVNPSGANGLKACSEEQIGYEGKGPDGLGAFSSEAARCPAASRIASVKIKTPLIDHMLPLPESGGDGSVYVATPRENPFGSLLALYIAVHDPKSGVVVKLAGKAEADPVTGQLTASFDETPQVPFEDFELGFFGGAGAALRTPSLCGEYASAATMTPWSAPASGPPAEETSPFQVTQPPPGQGSCPTSEAEEPNRPGFEAGTVTPLAGAYSPLVIHLRREDGSQEFAGLALRPPPGLIARLAGIPYCPEAALAEAAGKSGAAEKQSPSCPAASEVGLLDVGAGAGPTPYYATGHAYLAPPYKGAPLSLAIITPAVAGPYDLGTVVLRTALHIDPETGRVTATSDPIPHILEGIPLDVRSVAVKLDRSLFTLNPTNCEPFSFEGQLTSTLGQLAPLSDRFQVGECGRLRFQPHLSLRLSGGTARGAHPALRSVLTYPRGAYANIASASVSLPHSEFLAQEHIRTICTRVQFAARACPRGSIYGHATATSPLIDYPVKGPIYLRSSSHPLPDLVLALRGPESQPIELDAVARIDSHHGGIRASFDSVPDLPVSKVVLSMPSGAKGLLVNSTNVCQGTHRASAHFTAQNGRFIDLRPALRVGCGHKR